MSRRLVWVGLGCLLLLTGGCRAPGNPSASPSGSNRVVVAGVDTSSMTGSELAVWSELVSTELAPCKGVALSLAECVARSAPCSACLPAARFLATEIERGRSERQIEACYLARFGVDAVRTIDIGGSPIRGPKDAPVTIVEWADFQCPFCEHASEVLESLSKADARAVRVVFKQYPLAGHAHSQFAARAAIAAGDQGKFWEMHDALFADQQSGLGPDRVRELAKGLGLDMHRFETDLASQATASRLARDQAQAEQLGLDGTPFIFVNGRRFDLKLFDLAEDLPPWIETEVELTRSREGNGS